ncbi:POLG alternative reading frame-like [Hippopotamus amphibius kiboko]|uniref:POLG alternative reading frame-like n=1 Tax=Hippopotamus amphibius kiboko TaxID=575201 RepID=UPI00259227FD|nr:POLG alternative reading frame-like [Hippopotamus amphibius kiboko]
MCCLEHAFQKCSRQREAEHEDLTWSTPGMFPEQQRDQCTLRNVDKEVGEQRSREEREKAKGITSPSLEISLAPPAGPTWLAAGTSLARHARPGASYLRAPAASSGLEKKSLEARPRRPRGSLSARPAAGAAAAAPRPRAAGTTSYCGAAARSRTSLRDELIQPRSGAAGEGAPERGPESGPRDPGVLREQCGAAKSTSGAAWREQAGGRAAGERQSGAAFVCHSIATEQGGCANAASQRPGAAAAATRGDLARDEAKPLPAGAGWKRLHQPERGGRAGAREAGPGFNTPPGPAFMKTSFKKHFPRSR